LHLYISYWRYERVSIGLDRSILLKEEENPIRPVLINDQSQVEKLQDESFPSNFETEIFGVIGYFSLTNERKFCTSDKVGGEIL
jgi:hypothetical protein